MNIKITRDAQYTGCTLEIIPYKIWLTKMESYQQQKNGSNYEM